MIRAVIFDMYETLITHYHGRSSLYFSPQMSEEAGVSLEKFQAVWRGKEYERTIGKLSLEETLTQILKDTPVFSQELVMRMAEKRTATAEECFQYLHPEIIPMLSGLKEKGIRIGLISNCFSEEAQVIRKSRLAPYFDTICLSYELGMRKPEPEIYAECVKQLGVKPEDCFYIGDGGSSELEAANRFGMNVMQAVWYLKSRDDWPSRQKDDFRSLYSPMDVLKIEG